LKDLTAEVVSVESVPVNQDKNLSKTTCEPKCDAVDVNIKDPADSSEKKLHRSSTLSDSCNVVNEKESTASPESAEKLAEEKKQRQDLKPSLQYFYKGNNDIHANEVVVASPSSLLEAKEKELTVPMVQTDLSKQLDELQPRKEVNDKSNTKLFESGLSVVYVSHLPAS
jgi:paraquat-inducible protein B